MLGIFENIISWAGTKIGRTVLLIAIPFLLGFINAGKYGSILDAFMLGIGNTVSVFLKNKLGEKIGKLIEWFIIGLIINCAIFPFLSFFYGLTRDNKQPFGKIILRIKDIFYEWLGIIKLKKNKK